MAVARASISRLLVEESEIRLMFEGNINLESISEWGRQNLIRFNPTNR